MSVSIHCLTGDERKREEREDLGKRERIVKGVKRNKEQRERDTDGGS